MSNILQSINLEELAEDLLFHQELSKATGLKKKIFFDTSGIINMLLGMEAMFPGGRFNKSKYKSLSTLVYALAYGKRLGNIHTLPPHTDELVNKLQSVDNNILFREAPLYSDLENQFWGQLHLEMLTLKDLAYDAAHQETFIRSLKIDSIDLYMGIYLAKNRGFWKHRYKYLRPILNFEPVDNLQMRAITSKSLFKELQDFLNQKRPRNFNNYMDALALCLLDNELIDAEKTKEVPIFFCDQEVILEAVKHLSKKADKDGHYPFMWSTSSGEHHCVVRGAVFFIVEGIVESNGNKEQKEIFGSLTNSLIEFGHTNRAIPIHADMPAIVDNIKSGIKELSADTIFLEFFDRWRNENGMEEIKDIINIDPSDDLDSKIDEFIQEERSRLAAKFSKDSSRFRFIKKVWEQFHNLPSFIKREFKNSEGSYNVHKEVEPRFSFPERVCDDVQQWMDVIFASVQHANRKHELETIEAEAVTALIIGLFEEHKTEEQYKDRLLQLSKGLILLWVFEKYDFIDEVCVRVRSVFAPYLKVDDKYPDHSIALLHAAAIMLGSSKDRDRAQEIIDCVTHKFDDSNYKVWISLSYIYHLLWKLSMNTYDFPELRDELGTETPPFAPHYVELAGLYSEKSFKWLNKNRFNRENARSSERSRQRRYYYTINNYLFYIILNGSSETLKRQKNLADSLENLSANKDYWQANYADTIARYYYRLAYISATDREFKINLKYARHYNNLAIKDSRQDKMHYSKLSLDLDGLSDGGFEDLLKRRFGNRSFQAA